MENKDQNQKKGNRSGLIICLLIALGTFLVFSFMNNQIKSATNKKITYDQFIDMLEAGTVESVVLKSNEIEITPKAQQNSVYNITYYTGIINMDVQLVERLEKANVQFSQDTSGSSSSILYMILSTLFPIILLWGGLFFLFRMVSKNNGMMGVGKSTAKMYVQKETGVTFKDVAGQEEAMDSLKEVVDFLHTGVSALASFLPKKSQG